MRERKRPQEEHTGTVNGKGGKGAGIGLYFALQPKLNYVGMTKPGFKVKGWRMGEWINFDHRPLCVVSSFPPHSRPSSSSPLGRLPTRVSLSPDPRPGMQVVQL